MRFFFMLATFGVAAMPGFSQEKIEVEPDQRDFTRGTSVLPLGHVQVDVRLTATRRGAERAYDLAETQLRLPLSKRAEVRLNTPYFAVTRDPARESGAGDSELEARLVLSKSPRFATAVTLFSTLPTGSRRVAERRFQPGAVLSADFSLSPKANLLLNIGGERPTDQGQRFSRSLASAAFRFAPSPRVQLFSEVYFLERDKPGGPGQKFLNVGAVYFAGTRNAFYTRLGTGLGNGVGGPDYFYSLGTARLF